MPLLKELNIEGVQFREKCYVGEDEEIWDEISVVAERLRAGIPVERITLWNCFGLFDDDIEVLQGVAILVEWDRTEEMLLSAEYHKTEESPKPELEERQY
ncbi:hypothetical protein BXZ70DRAFT_1010259 [Cristinia sonorae]|uniref:Uncharacterized protein n=1 Tax=Cristinia sonorae TaxID=1940300 RepID=A0A8K0UJ14_9AGAR|nr:hypothetical protein BXZ70DRAFT_1010259 [Cristinia sonorae]